MNPTFTLRGAVAFAVSGMLLLFTIGCNKETPTKSSGIALTTSTNNGINKATVGGHSGSITNYNITGTLGNQPIEVTGSPQPYAVVDSNGNNPSNHCGNGHGPGAIDDPDGSHNQNDDNTYYVSGSLFNVPSGTGSSAIVTTNASIEVRKLSVRVFVAPIATPDLPHFYDLLNPTNTYVYASSGDPNNGVYLTLRDQSGNVWTSVGDQTGSTFQILTRGANNGAGSATTVTGVLSAKMYNTYGQMRSFNDVTFTALMGL